MKIRVTFSIKIRNIILAHLIQDCFSLNTNGFNFSLHRVEVLRTVLLLAYFSEFSFFCSMFWFIKSNMMMASELWYINVNFSQDENIDMHVYTIKMFIESHLFYKTFSST